MSFDLFFVADPSLPALTEARFVAHFASRPYYELSPRSADYLNPDTGVSFSFALHEPSAESAACASFTLACPRPDFFADEASIELASFAAAFDLLVQDPQSDVSLPSQFSRGLFLRSWDRSNRQAAQLFAREGFLRSARFPSAILRSAHAWNLARAELQRRLGDEVYVPSVMFAELDGTKCTLVVWSDGVPMLIPDFVDQVLVHREDLAPMRSLVAREERPGILDRAQALVLLASHGAEDASLVAFRPNYVDLPRELGRAISDLPPLTRKLVTFPPEQVLDEDLLAPVG